MNSESLSDLTTYIQRGISPKYAESGIPVINQKCIRNGQLNNDDVKFHDNQKTYSEEKVLRKNDILVNSTGVGTLGRVARFSGENKKMLADSHVTIVRPDLEKINPLFLFYVLRFNEPLIVELGAGSTGQTELSRLALGSLQIPILRQSAQSYVAKTLICLDEKIVVNQKLSKTLEDIAQTIFKSWFIDFDPVKAKMAGEKPAGMNAVTAALFPDSMVESELGPIPRGWAINLLGELITPRKGKTITKATCVYGEVPVVAGGLQPAYFHNKANVSQPAITVSASGANAGFVRLYLKDIWASDCSYINSEISQTVHFWYLFLLRNQELIYGMQQGAAQPHIYPSDLMRLKLSYPSLDDLVMKFEEKVTPLFLEIGVLERQNELLRNQRDSLLPRLISGEMEIPDEMLES